jgi:hypothetical protein
MRMRGDGARVARRVGWPTLPADSGNLLRSARAAYLNADYAI